MIVKRFNPSKKEVKSKTKGEGRDIVRICEIEILENTIYFNYVTYYEYSSYERYHFTLSNYEVYAIGVECKLCSKDSGKENSFNFINNDNNIYHVFYDTNFITTLDFYRTCIRNKYMDKNQKNGCIRETVKNLTDYEGITNYEKGVILLLKGDCDMYFEDENLDLLQLDQYERLLQLEGNIEFSREQAENILKEKDDEYTQFFVTHDSYFGIIMEPWKEITEENRHNYINERWWDTSRQEISLPIAILDNCIYKGGNKYEYRNKWKAVIENNNLRSYHVDNFIRDELYKLISKMKEEPYGLIYLLNRFLKGEELKQVKNILKQISKYCLENIYETKYETLDSDSTSFSTTVKAYPKLII